MHKGISIMLQVGMPSPEESCKHPKPEQKRPVEDKVREAIQLVDSGMDSQVEWILLNKLYKSLCELKKPTERAMSLKKMIEPVLSKYGYHSVTKDSRN